MQVTTDNINIETVAIAIVIIARIIIKLTPTKNDDNFFTEKILPVLNWLGLVVGEKNPVTDKEDNNAK